MDVNSDKVNNEDINEEMIITVPKNSKCSKVTEDLTLVCISDTHTYSLRPADLK
jgi:hypothetical protein